MAVLSDDKTTQQLIVYTGKIYDEKKVHLIIEALNDKVFSNQKIVIQVVGTIYEIGRASCRERV